MTISIVIPCHNADRWLAEAIESSLAQNCGEVEVIIVDDSSSDNSVAIATRFGSHVRLCRGNWQNGNSARNHGLGMVQGKWVQFLDADDFLKPNKISEQLAAATNDIDVLYSPLVIRYESKGEEILKQPTPGSDLIEQWLRWELCQTGAALWRTDALRELGGWKEGLRCCQDNELTLRALMAGLRFHYVDGPGAVYRIWSEETVCRKDPRRVIRQKTQLLDEALAWLERVGRIEEKHRLIVAQASFEMARTWACHDLPEAASFFAERKQRGLLKVIGPASSTKYRIIETLAGFQMAERVATWLR